MIEPKQTVSAFTQVKEDLMITGITNVRDRDTFTKKIQIGECSQKGTRECSSKEMVARKEGTI